MMKVESGGDVLPHGKIVRIGLHFLFGMKLGGFSLDKRSVEIADEILFGDWGVSGVGGPTYLCVASKVCLGYL